MSGGPPMPTDVLHALGLEPSDVGPSSTMPPAEGFDDVRARIAAELETRQGPWRARSATARLAPFMAALAFGLLFFVVVRPAPGADATRLVASLFAALAGVLALVAIAMATTRPALGERLSLAALVAGAGALVVEGTLALSMPGDAELGFVCFAMTLIGGLLPIVVVVATLRVSGLPVRRLHALSATMTGLALAGAAVWLHCPAEKMFHLVVGHMALPTLAIVCSAFFIARWLVRRRD
jgi:uncharacterized membrane protein YdcZ (DUF606 family)